MLLQIGNCLDRIFLCELREKDGKGAEYLILGGLNNLFVRSDVAKELFFNFEQWMHGQSSPWQGKSLYHWVEIFGVGRGNLKVRVISGDAQDLLTKPLLLSSVGRSLGVNPLKLLVEERNSGCCSESPLVNTSLCVRSCPIFSKFGDAFEPIRCLSDLFFLNSLQLSLSFSLSAELTQFVCLELSLSSLVCLLLSDGVFRFVSTGSMFLFHESSDLVKAAVACCCGPLDVVNFLL